jgi:hypothetical protein
MILLGDLGTFEQLMPTLESFISRPIVYLLTVNMQQQV